MTVQHLSFLKIATWNINSLRVRLAHILKWLQDEKPTLLALQEIKMENKNFPYDAFKEQGYYAIANGQKTYNGVALISRLPLAEIENPDRDPQHRLLSATLQGIRIVNAYVPNGESPISPKYAYKLNWLLFFKNYIQAQLKHYPRMIILGDLNIAPCAEDVHDPKAWEGQVLYSEPEKQAFKEIINLGFTDSFRLFPQLPDLFSWWDYRAGAFHRNAGLRIDHILISDALKPFCQSCWIDKTPRGWVQPSDHTPVIATFNTC